MYQRGSGSRPDLYFPPTTITYIRGSGRALLWEGSLLSDECFCHPALGTINVTQIIEQRPADLEPQRVPIDANILKMLASEHDPETLRRMTRARLEDPVIFTNLNGMTYLIDGSHRIFQRNLRKKTDVAAFFFDASALKYYKVRNFKMDEAGGLTEIELSAYLFRR